MANTIGWGQGSANNTNQWGRGSTNNSISWGSIYGLSPSGETNIIGGLQPTFELKYDLITTDFTFTRASFGTRVNEFGLIETVTDLGSDLVQNGSFDELGSEQVTNGDFENGTTDWDFGGDWTLVNGTAEILTSTNSFLIQSNIIPLTVKTYKIQYEVVSTNGSNFRFAGGNSAFGSVNLDSATVGVKTVYLTSNGTKGNLQFNQNAFRGSIDNISVKQVDPNDDWILGENTTIENSTVIVNNPSININGLTQNGILQSSTNYKVSFEILDYVQGNVRLFNSFDDNTIYTANGIYEVYTTSKTNADFKIFCQVNSILTIDNVSVQEVLEDDVPRIDYTGSTFDVAVLGSELVTNGDFDTDINGWVKGSGTTNPISWDSGKMKVTNDVALLNSARQSITTVIGKTYLVTADVDSTNGVNPRLATSNPTTAIIGTGGTIETLSYTFVATSTFSEINLYNWQNTLGAYNLWDNVSVKEVTAYTTTDKGAFLLEPISTNFIDYSEDFTDVYWIKSTSGSGIAPIVTTNYAVSPDGTQNADRIQFDATTSGSNADRSRIRTTLSLTDTSDYTFSFYAKSTDGTDQKIGVLFDNSQISTFTITDEWQRFEATATQFGTSSICGLDLRSGIAFTSDILVYGIQIEELSYATSYIPTNGTTVTRAQESSVKNNVNGLFDDNVGSIYLAYDGVLTSGTTLNNMNPFRLYGQGSNRIRLYYTPDADFLGSSVDFENGGKIAWSCNGTTILTYINGALVDTHTITSNFTTLTNFILSTPFMTHRINDIKIYDKALTDDELINLTTI